MICVDEPLVEHGFQLDLHIIPDKVQRRYFHAEKKKGADVVETNHYKP